MTRIALALFVIGAAFGCAARAKGRGAQAQAWSVRMADSIVARNPQPFQIEASSHKWNYATAFAVYAIARVGQRTGDSRYLDYATQYMSHFVNRDGVITTPTYDPQAYRLDDVAPGRLVLLLHASTGEPKYLRAADALAAQLRTQPRTSDGGFWHKQIYPHQMWLDGIYMACPFMVEYGRAKKEPQWFDECARQIITIARHTRDARTGLFHHGWDESRGEAWADRTTGLSSAFWGRAVGWYAMGIVETLDAMPADHPQRPELVQLFRALADTVVAVQDPTSGLWYQVLDQPKRAGNYLESSASCMFVYTLAKGARLGLLDAQHAAAARKGYDGILQRFVKEEADGRISLIDTCQVAGLGGNGKTRDGSFAYYISEPRVANDPKGLAPFMLAALEMEQADR
ncbi:MAG: unsaturated rhamnogalacturonyl hydrolase [Phycisphaerales bacterium]|nr:unsaturated rhamnogalacturonyl hydrolase [Phycisphaerales bacterium]